ncbi:MAG TPA: hypothetical protein DDW55_07485 [Gammaproteobacteria bacterium]|nr:hypothetical protein [Gammaproteobacteria bacterium]
MNSVKKILSLTVLSCITTTYALNLQAADTVETIKAGCSKIATDKTGYDPAKASSGGSTVAKGAGAGAVGGTVVRAVQGKSLLKGAAIGAAAGAGGGALKSNKDKKKAVLNQDAYQTEYNSCLKKNGLVPENVK